MRDSWLELVDCVLRPARPRLEACLVEREGHLAARQVLVEERTRALARCVAEIEAARAVVFAAEDGFVPSRMTELEREWRRLSRRDPDGGLMDLWARIAPAAWIDRKRWRDSDPARQVDAAIALASDPDGVENAEASIGSLAVALAGFGARVGSRVVWRASDEDFTQTAALLAEPLRAACEALSARSDGRLASIAVERAQQLEREVHEAALARFPERPVLADALGHAAMVDQVWRAASLPGRPNPVTSLSELWSTGYVLAAVDVSVVTVAVAPLKSS